MKHILTAVVAAAVLLPVTSLADTSITAAGSTALLPLVKASAASYQTQHPDVKISVSGGGSFVGISQASQGNIDLGDSDVVAPGGAGLMDHRVAVVGFGIIVHPDAGVTNLSAKQIRDIFAGRIINWKDVGGKDQNIVVINRPRSSGTRAVFSATIMGTSKINESGLVEDSSGTVVTTVGTTPGAVSYVALGYTKNKPVTVLKINGVEANAENIRTGKYPIWSYEHIFTKGRPKPEVDAFIRYIANNKEQIEELGFIQISTMKVSENGR
ncbi:MAG: phosphate ABC transporter substrate-binding protein [Candidatus Eremiobacteraeota bacterium]|nr:phosphate ABC transporter substrate-binding protein [Candidatus Eremiobacteraeota bacterium]